MRLKNGNIWRCLCDVRDFAKFRAKNGHAVVDNAVCSSCLEKKPRTVADNAVCSSCHKF